MKNVTKTNILFTFMVAFYLLIVFIVRLLPPQWISTNVRLVLPEIIMLTCSLLYVTFMKPSGLKNISFEMPSVSNIIRIVIMTLCLIPFITLINNISSVFVNNKVVGVMSAVEDKPLWVKLILMALIPAACEEYIFRGLIFNGYKKRNPLGAVLMSSLLFGLIHMNVNQFIYAFLLGCIFCMLVYATGTIISSMIAHFIFNGFNVIISHLSADTVSESVGTQTPSTADYIMVYVSMTMLAAVGVYLAYRLFKAICRTNRGFECVKLMFKKENRRTYEANQGNFFDWYVGIGILLCIAYIALYGM